MPTLFALFPPAEAAEALAYEAECAAHYRALSGEEGHWALRPIDEAGTLGLGRDVDGAWVAPIFGPPFTWAGVEVEEPASCAALRAGRDVVPTPDWPPED